VSDGTSAILDLRGKQETPVLSLRLQRVDDVCSRHHQARTTKNSPSGALWLPWQVPGPSNKPLRDNWLHFGPCHKTALANKSRRQMATRKIIDAFRYGYPSFGPASFARTLGALCCVGLQ
jgi:hypothetical protein